MDDAHKNSTTESAFGRASRWTSSKGYMGQKLPFRDYRLDDRPERSSFLHAARHMRLDRQLRKPS